MTRYTRKRSWPVALAVLFLALALGAYAKRGDITHWVSEQQKPDVPAVAYQPGTAQGEGTKDEATQMPDSSSPSGSPAEAEDVPSPEEPDNGSASTAGSQQPTDVSPGPSESPTTSSASLPTEYNLAVPFTSQAPKSNWDEVHEETCEEASSLMTAYYYQGLPAGKVDSDKADADLMKIVDFENSFFGFYKDTTAEQTATLIETYFQLNTELITNPTVEQIKQALVDGHPVIVPAAGRMLGNPNFTGAGPLYHMFVVKGYTADGFITNDPGTRLGADYFYSYDTVMNAMHDWNDGDVNNGQKIVIVVKP